MLRFSNLREHAANRNLGLCAGWSKDAETPVGTYNLHFFDKGRGRGFYVQFDGDTVCESETEEEAKTAAQKHFNELVNECQRFTN